MFPKVAKYAIEKKLLKDESREHPYQQAKETGSSKVYVLLFCICKKASELVSYSVKRLINFTGTFLLSVNKGVIWSFLIGYVHLSSSQVFQVCPKISEVGSKQVGTKLPYDLIMIQVGSGQVGSESASKS